MLNNTGNTSDIFWATETAIIPFFSTPMAINLKTAMNKKPKKRTE